jgi:hypothetical protein
VSASESEADSNRDAASNGNQEGGLEGNNDDVDEVEGSEKEERMVDGLLDAGGAELKGGDEIRGWHELHEQIKQDLQDAEKQKAPLSKKNQLLVLRNFATLRIKGCGRIAASNEIAWQWHEGKGTHFARWVCVLARHYQLFEQLPDEKRGGDRGHSLFNDERVQSASRAYLASLATGEVTPMRFQRALNEHILLSLGIELKDNGLSERTARRWLVKLGWRNTRLKKGVYMDGHEREDVREYRNSKFLPLMAKYEKAMVKWNLVNSELKREDPILGPGEKRIVPVFQDESSFHANEYKQNLWCAP